MAGDDPSRRVHAGPLAGVLPAAIDIPAAAGNNISGRKGCAGEEEETGGLHRGSKRRCCCWQKLN